MKIWKKNLVAAAVLLTVCGGIYANWVYTNEQAMTDLTDTLDENKIMASDTLVMSSEDNLSNTSADTMDNYFAAVRLSRQEARDSAVSLLQEAMAYSNNEAYENTNAELEEIVDIALCEAQIESLIIAKGYKDCVAYIADDAISVAVAVNEGELQQADVAVIADVVITQSDFEMEQIHVIEVK